METSPLAQRWARRFVAGETLDEALAVGRKIHAEGIAITLDHLGESVRSLEEAGEAREVYLRTLRAMCRAGLEPNVSVKLTQFGLDFSYDQCRDNVSQLVRAAGDMAGFVRVDMESSAYAPRTLALVGDLHQQCGAVGVVIQAYLHRSRDDVEMLCQRGVRVRLCKGAYLEPASVAFQQKSEVDRNFIELMKILLERGAYPAIATHDEKMIEATMDHAEALKRPREAFEFQMLYGIRRDLQRRLVAEGFRLRLYVPFGQAWYPYYMRRLAERPANVLFIARHLFRQ
jgi:proline dehydrogenase